MALDEKQLPNFKRFQILQGVASRLGYRGAVARSSVGALGALMELK
jgi:hypothetical protein